VLGLEPEGGGVGLGGAGVVAGELELTGQGDVSPDAVVVAGLWLGLREGLPEGVGGLLGTAQARERDAAVEVAVEPVGVEPGDLGELEERGLEVAARELGEAQAVVGVAGAVVEGDGLEERGLGVVVLA